MMEAGEQISFRQLGHDFVCRSARERQEWQNLAVQDPQWDGFWSIS